jgi:mutator protein MutT
MTAERSLFNIAAFVALSKDDQVLLIRRINTGHQDGNYHLPAGHLEKGETPLECVRREVREEVGIEPEDLIPTTIVFNTSGEKPYMDVFFVSSKWQGEIQNREPSKCDDVRWFERSSLPTNLAPEVREALINWQEGIIYSEI